MLTSKNIDSEIDKTECKIYQNNNPNMKILANKILEGELVVFPTETVYGLGANGLDKEAVNKIFKIKNRPSNNPIILHCLGYYDSRQLVNITEEDDFWFKSLTDYFWPGPLTIILKAKDIIPDNVTCNTGYVGIRAPKHDSIRSIIQYSQTPIAAPSANLSGKTSSTCIEHVKRYFEGYPINIIDDNNYISKYGIESTVIKLENSKISILREGFITRTDLDKFCNKINKDNKYNYLNIIKSEKLENNVSPGQLSSHYCPNKPLYILNLIDFRGLPEDNLTEINKLTENYLKNSVLIDFNSCCFKYTDKFLGYVDLSSNGDFKEAMFNLYNVFHQFNDIECDKIYIYNFSNIDNEYSESIWNRINRAAENKSISIPINYL
jgi:L-threonylcarbamoyladenylate synthase